MEQQMNRIFERIAKENNAKPEEVYREIEIAIAAAFSNPTPKEKQFQDALFHGRIPTPEEFIEAVSGQLQKQGLY